MSENLKNSGTHESSHPAFRRRIIVIKRALQMKYVMLVFVFVLFTVSIISLDVYYVIGKLILKEFGDVNLMPLVKSASRLLGLHFSVFLVIVVLASIFISHKFAGPIFRLEKISESVAKGDLTVRANFRQGDELFETAEYINQMIDSLREKIKREKNLTEEIYGKLSDLSNKLQNGDITPKEASVMLKECLVQLGGIGKDFKL